ncbi:MAG: dehydrogenase [Propionibacteriales bacterium]|nr:dehydrogenase [Propionibacteriales bacterium]
MRLGLAGVGRIGGSHAGVLKQHPDVESLVLADADHVRAKEVAGRIGCESAGSVDELFDAGVDAVVIAAATSAHADLLTRASRAGLPAFCEKPIAGTVDETLAVIGEVKRSGVPVQIGFMRRFDAGYRTARERLRSGALGELHRVHMVTCDPAPPPAEYISTSGGLFRDCHIHDFDIMRWVTGVDAVEVYARGANRGADYFRDAGDVDNAAALLSLADGTLATLQGSRYNGGGYDVRMELAGSAATYAVGLDQKMAVASAEPGETYPGGTPWQNFWERFTPAYRAEINAFIDLVKGEIDNPCTVDEALEALWVAEAADRSLHEGRPVRVDEVRQ